MSMFCWPHKYGAHTWNLILINPWEPKTDMRDMVSCRNVAHWARNLSQICVRRLHLEDSSSTAHGGNKGFWWCGQQLPGSWGEEVALATVLRTALPLCSLAQWSHPAWQSSVSWSWEQKTDQMQPRSLPYLKLILECSYKGQLPSKRRFVFCSQLVQTSKVLQPASLSPWALC